jgi:hypothetical protein
VRAWILAAISLIPLAAAAQEGDAAMDANGYVALSADDEAQASLGGFRRYLERIRPTDPDLYLALDPTLDGLQERETWADVIFWTGTILGGGAMIAAIPVASEGPLADRTAIAIGLISAGATTFLLGLIINAFVRPNHDDLMQLVDRHDSLVGRR